PDAVPADPADLATPRWSVRSRGDAAFLFYSSHVRQYATAAQKDVRFAVKLPGGTVTLPRQGIEIPAGSYFIWPVNFDLDGYKVRYATAQPVARLDDGAGTTYVFAAQAGIPVEFALDGTARACVRGHATGASGDDVMVEAIAPGTGAAFRLDCPGRRAVTVLVLAADQARRLTVADIAGRRRLVLSSAQAYADRGRLVLRSAGEPHVTAAVYPPLRLPATSSAPLRVAGTDGLFQALEATLPAVDIPVTATPLRAAQPVPPVRIGGGAKAALLPDAETFGASAAWQLAVPRVLPKGIDGALLDIAFTGDVARLLDGTRMVDDWYYNGQRWQYDLRNLAPANTGASKAAD
ncbi:MAG: glycoside hydrolase family 35, partial [Massilia sp.]|nr:glycoside hydrolase family 35 [Massilia sp.]